MSEEYAIIYSPQAKDDLLAIYSYIAFELREPMSAKGQVDRIRKMIRSLGFMPARHPLLEWEPWHSMGILRISVDKFEVYYAADDTACEIEVIRICYGGRDIRNILNGV